MTHSSDPRALAHTASVMERAGRLAEAEAAYVQLLARWPDLADSWYNLARLQSRLGRYEAALASYQQALDRGAACPEEVHLNRGVIFSDHLRQDAAAEGELNAALALNPNYVPALLNLANLREDFGRRDEALALYRKILALQPHCFEALARYATLEDVGGPEDQLIEQLESAIFSTEATAEDRASLGFALGKKLDECGAYDRAFDAYCTANRHSREGVDPRISTYNRRQHESLIGELIATFTPDRNRPPQPAPPARPIFICGMFRSGSTLTEQVLAAHTQVTAGGEIAFLPSLVRTALAPFPASMSRMTQRYIDVLATQYLDMLAKRFGGAKHVTDKRPDNFLYIGLIKRLFPSARIVHTTRHPLDNWLSIFFLHLDQRMSYALDLQDIAHYYSQYRRVMAHWKALYGADILDFDYDEFVREPRPAVERLLKFCDLPWEESCMSFPQVRNAVKTASVWQVREPLYRRSSGRWKNYATHLEALQETLRDYRPDEERKD
jgi:hypothetical protein